MDVNGRSFSASAARAKTPRGAGVIEVNVAQKNMAHVFGPEANLAKPGHHIVEGGFRTGIEKGEAVIGFKRSSGDDAGAAELVSVDDVDHRGKDVRRQMSEVRRKAKLSVNS